MNHAYLIIAHSNPKTLLHLLNELDYSNNDIFLHVDVKSANLYNFCKQISLKKANFHFFSRVNVRWGHYSQILVEKELLTEATKTYHDYYHLISGVDLPIKTHNEIDEFFETYKGNEFVEIIDNYSDKKIRKRIGCFNIKVSRKNSFSYFITRGFREFFCFMQCCFFVNKIKKFGPNKIFKKGSNWFDITHDFAIYALEVMQETWFKKVFRFSFCGDEIFLPTLIFNSPFRDKNLGFVPRYTKWSANSPSPLTLYISDIPTLKSSKALFARKFSDSISFKTKNVK